MSSARAEHILASTCFFRPTLALTSTRLWARGRTSPNSVGLQRRDRDTKLDGGFHSDEVPRKINRKPILFNYVGRTSPGTNLGIYRLSLEFWFVACLVEGDAVWFGRSSVQYFASFCETTRCHLPENSNAYIRTVAITQYCEL